MGKTRLGIWTVIVWFLAVSTAFADIDHWPDWLYDSNAQYASWDSWYSSGVSDGWYEFNFAHDHGLAAPYYEVDNEVNTVLESFGGRTDVLQTDHAGSLVFHFDNYDVLGPEKWVRLIVNFYAPSLSSWDGLDVVSIGVAGTDPYSDPDFLWDEYYSNPGNELNFSSAGWVDQGDGWIIAAYDFKIEPSPGEEWIQVIFGYEYDRYTFYEDEVYIDEAQIHTRAVVPAPSGLWLMGSGLLSLAWIFRKR